jgi:mycothiol synthase
MRVPDGYDLRAPRPDELDAVAAVLAAAERNDAGEPALDADFLRDAWSRPGFVLPRDAWVAVDGEGTIAGYAEAALEEPDLVESWGAVHPDHRGRGIGSALLDRIEARAAEMLAGVPTPRFRHAIGGGDEAAAAMLRARGLRAVRTFWHMRIDLIEPPDRGAAPDGIEIRGVRPDRDLPAVHAVLEDAFADDRGYHPTELERWIDEHVRSPSHDPTLWLLAEDRGRPVGALTAAEGPSRGWVHELGVRRTHRGRGIGTALLRHAFAGFAGRGLRTVLLNVDAENPTGATALYERAGMRVTWWWELWERSPGGPR